jgi:hypothetical protein
MWRVRRHILRHGAGLNFVADAAIRTARLASIEFGNLQNNSWNSMGTGLRFGTDKLLIALVFRTPVGCANNLNSLADNRDGLCGALSALRPRNRFTERSRRRCISAVICLFGADQSAVGQQWAHPERTRTRDERSTTTPLILGNGLNALCSVISQHIQAANGFFRYRRSRAHSYVVSAFPHAFLPGPLTGDS